MISPLNTPGNKKKQRAEGSPLLLLAACSHLDAPEPAFVAIPPWVGAVGARRGPWAQPRPEPGSGARGGQRGHPRPGRPVGAAPRRGATAPPGGGTGRNRARLLPAASVQPPEEGTRKGGEGRSQERCRVGAAPSRPVGCAEPGAAGLLLGRSGKGPGGGTAGRGARLSLAITRRCKQRE